jgi:hypothetical protein
MSVEKLDSAKIKQDKIPYTQHLNYVLQNLRDTTALAIWCYLTSLPDDWVVHRTQLMEHFNIGRTKLGTALKFLSDNRLIEYLVQKDDKGKIEAWHIMVKAGHEFEVIHRSQSTLPKTHTVESPHSGKSAPTKEIRNTNKKVYKNKSFCANAQKKSKSEWKAENERVHEFAESKNQMANEAKHIEEHEQIKRAPMPDSLRSIIQDLKRAH